MKKQQYWQMIRGICILAVIMIHCPQGGVAWLGIRQVVDFPVALFVFMAGLFVNPIKVSSHWLKKRVGRLLLPFLVWSSVYSIKRAIFDSANLKMLFYDFIIGKSITPLYFILVLLQLTLLTPYLVDRKKGMYLITPIYLVYIYAYNISTGSMPLLYETLFPTWVFFYLLGMDVREGKYRDFAVKGWMIGLALLVSFGEVYLMLKWGCSIGFVSSQIKLSSFIYATLIALWLSQHYQETESNVLSTIGDCSFGIYFSHILVMWIVSKVLSMVGVDTWVWKWSLTFLFTFMFDYVIVWSVRKIFASKKILKYIGFE